jgi:AhpD family alkylhydroperoxidase
MKLITTVALALLASASLAEESAKFYQETYPGYALASRMEAEAVLMGDGAQLNAKTRELIALGVAAQIPCAYCIYVHAKNARAQGASESEVREAVATAAHVRHWSTVLNGMGYDFEAFKPKKSS